MPRLTPEQLETRLHALLREQPLRPAPVSLEQRVMAEIARRAALPWWRKSYSDWPAAVRILFVLLGLAAVAVAALVATRFLGDLPLRATLNLLLQPLAEAWMALRAAGTALAEVAGGWIPAVPALWMYIALGAVGTAYAILVGLGATAYRLLWQPR